MTNDFDFSIYYTVGRIGDEANAKTETLNLSWDPDLSDEENQVNLEFRSKIVQMRLQSHVAEILASAAPELLGNLMGDS